jgi:hypothetical protein
MTNLQVEAYPGQSHILTENVPQATSSVAADISLLSAILIDMD